MTGPGADPLLGGLDEQQRLAAETLFGPVCLLAGAGTGKTRTITHRIAHGVLSGAYSPARVMALTFTSKAAAELRSRLRVLGVSGVAARTFHAAALAQLGYFWPQLTGTGLPRILGQKGRLVADAARALRIELDTATLRDAAAEIEWRKISALTIEQYREAAAMRPLPAGLTPERAVELQERYEAMKDERRQLDFEDVLLATAGMIEAEPWVAQQVREQYRFFVVDEYQDVSPLQQRLLELWLGGRDDLCVVGDASQTIYSFAGASARYLLGFASRYREARIIRLEQNYRSTSAIVAAANRLVRDRPGALSLRATAGASEPPTVTAYRDDRGEAEGVAERIADQIASGTRPEEIAVLFRVNGQSQAIESALAARGIGSQVHGGPRFFELQEVKQALMMLKGATVAPLSEPLFKTVSDVLRSLGWTQDPPETAGAVRDRWESLNVLMTLAEESPSGTTLRQFVDGLLERAADQHEPERSVVTLATMHSAKGLEWHTVHIVGLSEGLMPIGHARSEAEIEEERRLLYVGLTRARERLHLSWAARGAQHAAERRPSRFLEALRSRIPDAATS